MRHLATIAALLLIVATFYGGVRTVTRPNLRYFSASEFGIWWPLMNSDLLLKLDEFRHRWGAPVMISPVDGALGRHAGDSSQSQHNVDLFGEVRAADVFPRVGSGFIQTEGERRRAYRIAVEVGFTGIGVYTDTTPGNMLHLDVRTDRQPGNPALWSRVSGQFKGIGEVV